MSKDKMLSQKPSRSTHLELDFHNLLFLLQENKWLISVITFCVISICALWLLNLPAEYQSSALIQVENKSNSLGAFDNLNNMLDLHSNAVPSDIQKALISSPFILNTVIHDLNLNLHITPHYFPVLGAPIAKHYLFSSAPLGLSQFSWGQEKIQIPQFIIPNVYLEKKFKLVSLGQGKYQIYDPNNQLILTGKVGETATAKNQQDKFFILVTELVTTPGVKFTLERVSIHQEREEIYKKLLIEDVGNSEPSNNKTGILRLSLVGTDPQKITYIVNSIVTTALKKDTEYKSLEASKKLQFLNQQLPQVKTQLINAESYLNNYLVRKGKLNVDVETEIFLNQLTELEKQLNETKLKKIGLLQQFTSQHPFILQLNARQSQLQIELQQLKARLKKLPTEEQITINLTRDVKIKEGLYSALLKKIQELEVIAAGMVDNIRVLNLATVPDKPLPSKSLIKLLAALFVGLLLGSLIAAIRKFFHRGIEDPHWMEENLNIPTLAIIPYSKKQKRAEQLFTKGLAKNIPLITTTSPQEIATEALRSLRTTLQFTLFDSNNNIIALLGSRPGIGKSFISVNFANLLANGDQHILLIDADLRQGNLYHYFNIPKTPGLTAVIQGKCSFEQAVHISQNSNLHVLPSGEYHTKSAELLLSKKFKEFLLNVSAQYDLIVIDTPPILAITDGMVIARQAGVNFLVVANGMHQAEEMELAVKRFYNNGIKLHGAIYNNISAEKGLGTFKKYRYNYYYQYENN